MEKAAEIKIADQKGSFRDSVATITKDGHRNFIKLQKKNKT
jgi:hypothetical protein